MVISHEIGFPSHPRKAPDVVLDNSSTHSTAEINVARKKSANPVPLHADERVVVESGRRFFGILGKQSLGVGDFPSKLALRDHIEAYMEH
jgi:hypothetical protein